MGTRNNISRVGGAPIFRSEEEHFEAMNESLSEKLSVKVRQLKHLAIDLDEETRDHLTLLGGMSDDMETGTMRQGAASGRLRDIGKSRGLSWKRTTCYVGLGVCFVMAISHKLIRFLFN